MVIQGGCGMDFSFIWMYLSLSFLFSMHNRNITIGMIERIGIDVHRYPKGYVKPARWVKSIFKIKQRSIPRYLYFELLLTVFYALLAPINIIITIVLYWVPDIIGILCMFHLCLFFINLIFFLIWSHHRRKRK